MLTVYKYPIPATLTDNLGPDGEPGIRFENEFTIEIPNPGIITRMAAQPSRTPHLQIWALVDDDQAAVVRERRFVFLGTGHTTRHTNLLFIDAWITDGLVFHLFEVMNPELEAGEDKVGGTQ